MGRVAESPLVARQRSLFLSDQGFLARKGKIGTLNNSLVLGSLHSISSSLHPPSLLLLSLPEHTT